MIDVMTNRISREVETITFYFCAHIARSLISNKNLALKWFTPSLCTFLICLCFHLSDRSEKGVLHGFSRRNSSILVVDKHLVKEINRILCNAPLVVLVNVGFEWDLFCVRDEFCQLFWHIDAIPAHVFIKVCCAHSVDNLH